MSEDKQEKKKPTIVKQIFKWIGLGLPTLLLIAALIFQAPWKVITLLAIILLACTVLPRALRKWFWFSAGAIVIALIIWVFLPDRDGDWKPYTFDEELAVLEAKYAIPDSENAATIYNQLLEDYDANAFELDFLDDEQDRLTRDEPWSSKDYPQIAEWLQTHESTITKLVEASKIEKCRFPIVADSMAIGQHMKILIPMRRWAFLLVRAANNDLGEGRIDAGLEKYLCVIQMAKHLCQQPRLVDLLVGIAVEAVAVKQFKRFVVTGDAAEEHLTLIEEALTEIKHDWTTDWLKIVECEKLMTKNMLCGMVYQVNPKGKVRLRRKFIKASFILAWFFIPSTPQKASEIIDAVYERYYAMAEPDFDWKKEPKEFSPKFRLNYRYLVEHLAGILEPAYYRIHDIYLRIDSDQRGSRVIIALRRYKNQNGTWPKSLDDVKPLAPAEIFIDPVSGGSFVYKPTEENFTLYSKGKNNIDEGGQYNSKWDPNTFEHKVEEDDRLIWPARSRKTKKKNHDAE